MKRYIGYAVGLTIATALLGGCAGSAGTGMPPVGSPALVQRFAQGNGEVQYLANYYTGLIEFDYPKGVSPVGSINFAGGGLCTIGARTFWATGATGIAEFKVGGTMPIRVLTANAGDCAVDPATGDLAATTFDPGGVIIFHKARGKGKVFTGLDLAYFTGYDDKSDLFVDGFGSTGSRAVELIELKKGSSTFETITMNTPVQFPGSVQWDGKYLAIFDQLTNAVDRYLVSGTNATLKDTVSLSGASDCAATWIAQPYVYCADAGNNAAEVFKYPTGGALIATLGGSFSTPLGVVSVRVR